MEQVNHPTHYNQHMAGIECIDIIRHYTCDIANALKYLWRAGLKPEMGKEDAEKEIEDLHKALWYIKDYADWCHRSTPQVCPLVILVDRMKAVTGYTPEQIIEGYEKNVAAAMNELLRVGLIVLKEGVWHRRKWHLSLDIATRCIEQRILEINDKLKESELEMKKLQEEKTEI